MYVKWTLTRRFEEKIVFLKFENEDVTESFLSDNIPVEYLN